MKNKDKLPIHASVLMKEIENLREKIDVLQGEELAFRLKSIPALKREVDALSQRIAEIESVLRNGESRTTGLFNITVDAQSKRQMHSQLILLEKLQKRRADSMAELGQLYSLIDSIPDAQIRLIFTYRYIDRLTWQQIAFRIGEYDEQYPRRIHNKALRMLRTLIESEGLTD